MLTPEQKLKICEVLSVTPMELEAQISFLGVKFTAEIETAIAGKLTEWSNGIGQNFTTFTPTESNKGFNLSPEAAKNQIISSIALWLERSDWKQNASIGRLRRS